jgi:L-malate glycosyltransferase
LFPRRLHAILEGEDVVEVHSRVRVLNVVVDFGCGGTERQVVALSAALRERCDLQFACMRREGQLLRDIEAMGLPIREYRFPAFYSLQCLRQQRRLARAIARDRIDIVHAYNFYSNVFALPPAWWTAAPVRIASIRDRGVYLSRSQRMVQRYVCRLADCVLVNADAIRDWLVDDGYEPDRIVVIRNGVDLSRFPLTPPRDDLRRQFDIPPQAPVVGVVGRVRTMKGVEDAIDAAAELSQRVPDLRLVVVGEAVVIRDGVPTEDRGYIETLKTRARDAGLGDRAIFTGYRPDVAEILSQLTVSVQPSLNEGLSNVVLESMAAGVPVVATRVGGTPEALIDEVSGLLVPPANPPALAAAIGRMLDDPSRAREMGLAARRRIESEFSLARMYHDTEQLYRDLLERRHAAPGGRRVVPSPLHGSPAEDSSWR